MTSTADLIRFLLEKGVALDVALAASEIAEQGIRSVLSNQVSADSRPTSDDAALERRRAADRERQRLNRKLRLPEPEWRAMVNYIVKRDGGKCVYCDSTDRLTADHMVPLSRGGTNDESNLAACCLSCNSKKGNKTVAEWLPKVSADIQPTSADSRPTSSALASATSENLSSCNNNIINNLLGERGAPAREGRLSADKRGTRIPENWEPEDPDFANEILGSPERAKWELAKFRDYWASEVGPKTVKRDWQAAWRTWVRRCDGLSFIPNDPGWGKIGGMRIRGQRNGGIIGAINRLESKIEVDRELPENTVLQLPLGSVRRP